MRPISLTSAYCSLNGIDFPMFLVGLDQFNDITLKTSQSDLPNYLCFINSAPNVIVRIWPVPYLAQTITMNANAPLSFIASTATLLTLPPGMWLAMQWSLALMLWPSYNGVETPPQALVQGAQKFKSNFKRANRKQLVQQFDPALSGICYTDWRTG